LHENLIKDSPLATFDRKWKKIYHKEGEHRRSQVEDLSRETKSGRESERRAKCVESDRGREIERK